MELRQVDIGERNFLILAESIDQEFGNEIPWLNDLSDLRLSMNVDYFREKFIKCVNATLDPENVIAYSLVSTDHSQTFLGGMLHLPISPEKFENTNLASISDQLDANHYSYITCLHMRDVVRGKGQGAELFSNAMSEILSRYPQVWGVVSKEKLLPWYEHFGATTLQHMSENEEGLAIITFDEKTFRARNY